MAPLDLSEEYLLELPGPNFELRLVNDDSFYQKEFAFVTIKEFIFSGQDEGFETFKKIVKVICLNRSHSVYDKNTGIRNDYCNLALVDLEVHKGRDHLIAVNSTPTCVSINQNRVQFQLIDVLGNMTLDFSRFKRAYVRISLSAVRV